MNSLTVIAASFVTPANIPAARFGMRFGRLDLLSQLALSAVELLQIDFTAFGRDRVGICVIVRAGSLSTDVEYWAGRDAPGGPSPMLFAYTLPSSAIGEIAIRHQLMGPNLCLIGGDALAEAKDWIVRGEADACICVACDVITPAAGTLIEEPAVATARALFLARADTGMHRLQENDRDMNLLCDKILSQKPARPI